jgi:hypothetical protein
MDAPWIKRRLQRPTPAFVIAMIALFVALGGTAGAVATATVPLAKRALVADKAKTALIAENAKKLGGQTSAQIVQAAAQAPGPASSALGLISTKTSSVQIGAGSGGAYTVQCDAGQKVVSGGFIADNVVILALANGPVNESTWGVGLLNLDDAAPANVNLYGICIK